MTRICWWLVDKVSRMLEPGERDVVRGDLAESGETGGQALRDVLGLVVRRQAALWKDWRPWLALMGLVVPLAMLLSQISRRVADGSAVPIWMYLNNWTWTYLTNAGARLDLVQYSGRIFLDYLMLICGAWTSGFAVGSLSRPTVRVHGALFCFLLLVGGLYNRHPWHAPVFSLTFYNVVLPMIVQTILVLLPSLWGIRRSLS